MSRDKRYQQLLNSKRWKQLRQWKIQRNPKCELCEAEGKIVSMVDVHHKVPVESAHTLAEMEQLCYNPDNLLSVCIPCHIKLHADERSHSKEGHQQREADRHERWKDRQRRKPTWMK